MKCLVAWVIHLDDCGRSEMSLKIGDEEHCVRYLANQILETHTFVVIVQHLWRTWK